MPSVADLRAKPPTSRPERVMTVSLRPDLQATIDSLRAQLVQAELQLAISPDDPGATDEDGNRTGPPTTLAGNKSSAQREAEDRKAAILAEIHDKMAEQAEYEGELRLRATPDGAWRLWADAHPARHEDTTEGKRDLRVAGGFCNADALTANLGPYLNAWDGEALTASDWADWLDEAMSAPEKVKAAQLVVSMQEVGMDFQQSRQGLSINLARLRDSN